MVKQCRERNRLSGRVLRRRRCTCGESLRRDVIEIISHEFRTPLTSLKGFLQVLTRSGGAIGPADQADMLKIMYENTEELRYLVDKVVLAARLEADQAPGLAPVNLSLAAVQALESFSRHLGERGTAVCLDLPPVLGPVDGDPYYLKQMIAQLICNSLKYAAPDSALTVTGHNFSSDAVLVISDDSAGAGLPQASLPQAGLPQASLDRLLRPFARGEAPGRGAHPGGGLGLYIVQKIVDRHGGSLFMHSQADRGVAVEVWLPRTPISWLAYGG